MKQILQNLGSGETILAEVPRPACGQGAVLAKTSQSLVSLGTEKMLIEFGRGGLISKARSQPDKVKQVLQKIKTDGLWETIDAVKAKLDTPIALGYCNVGRVAETCDSGGYQVGDRIVSNGPHAEFVSVPQNLTAKVPEGVSDETAAFTVVAAIGLQGIRLIQPTLGERVVVCGLGLIGLLSVQLLRAQGCQVLGIDYDPIKLELARKFGAETCDLSADQDPVAKAMHWTDGVGVDAVLITASTRSDELMHQAASMSRQRGRIVLVGVVGLQLRRADFYEKELSFQVSCSYGPGRYDTNYEQRGLDYPIGFVRWTEQRNFQAVLQLMAEGKINVAPLISHRFAFDDALSGYEAINDPAALGILLQYDDDRQEKRKTDQEASPATSVPSALSVGHVASPQLPGRGRDIRIAFIGAGGFATRMLLPALPEKGIQRQCVVSRNGMSAAHAAKRFGFKTTSGDWKEVLADDAIDAVFIATPHHLHGEMVRRAIEADKDVFVEKPLALNCDELTQIKASLEQHSTRCLMVGFNRRFSPHIRKMQDWLRAASANKAVVITVNAGQIPADHWIHDRQVGGGRIVGEGCHFIDLARFLIGSPIIDTSIVPVEGGDGRLDDCVAIQLRFEDGSIATIHYLSNGSKDFAKERIEVFADGRVYLCDNFRTSRIFGSRARFKTRRQDKGHQQEVAEFLRVVREGGVPPIPYDELFEVSRIAIDLQP